MCSTTSPKPSALFIGRRLDRAWRETDPERAEAELRALAKQLQPDHPGAAASFQEGLEETVTVTRLGLSPSLLRTFKSTNPIESMISVAKTVTGNVKRWRNGQMILRWTAAGVQEAEKQFRRVNSYRDLQLLRLALKATLPSSTSGVRHGGLSSRLDGASLSPGESQRPRRGRPVASQRLALVTRRVKLRQSALRRSVQIRGQLVPNHSLLDGSWLGSRARARADQSEDTLWPTS